MKKKKLYYTKNGYSYITCNAADCLNWGGLAICDDCGKRMDNLVYLIFVLGRAYCPQCFIKWNNCSERFEDDIKLQNEKHIKWYEFHKFEIIE